MITNDTLRSASVAVIHALIVVISGFTMTVAVCLIEEKEMPIQAPPRLQRTTSTTDQRSSRISGLPLHCILIPGLILIVGATCLFSKKHSDRRSRKMQHSRCSLATASPCTISSLLASSVARNPKPSLSLCPLAAAGKKKAHRRSLLTKVGDHRFSSSRSQQSSNGPRSFWDLYQEIASHHTGFFGEVHDPTLQGYPILRAIVNLAETESPEQYAKCDADEYRLWLETHLKRIVSSKDSGSIQKELDKVKRAQLQVVFCGCLYLRHSWHQGNPSEEPVTDVRPTDSQGNQLEEPVLLTAAVEYAARRLGSVPYLNLYSFMFCNWMWTPAGDNDSDFSLVTHEKLCDIRSGTMSPRFCFLTGIERQSEVTLWRGFAYSELMSVPMYGEIGRLIDQLNGPTSPEAIAVVLKCLSNICFVTCNICAALVTYTQTELMDPLHFIKVQRSVFYADQSAGANGFQLPGIVMLDMLLGVDYASIVSTKLQNIRDDNIAEMAPQVQHLIYDHVRPAGIKLRQFVDSAPCPRSKEELRQAFNAIARQLMLFRATHRARAGKFLKASSTTAGRNVEGNDVLTAFNQDMSCILAATKKAVIV